MIEQTTAVEEWQRRYREVQREYADALLQYGSDENPDAMPTPASVFENHDDALAELAHEASVIFTHMKERP